MKFFLPNATSDQNAEDILQAISEHTMFPVPTPRVYRISYEHNGQEMEAAVGGQPDRYYRENGPVVAILHRPGLYAVCLNDRGVVRGEPILVGQDKVRRVVHFDQAS